MFAFLRSRAFTSLLPLLVVLFGVFLLARLTGNPTDLYLPESATPAQRADEMDSLSSCRARMVCRT